MKQHVVYKITSPNNRVYIGSTNNATKRFSAYLKLQCKRQTRLYASLVKHGPANHKMEIIHESDITDVLKWERLWGEYYKVFSESGLNCVLPSYNEIKGSMYEETKRKISLSRKGMKFSAETKRRIGERSSNRSAETRLKISIGNKGKKMTPEMRKHISDAVRGEKNGFYGRRHTPENIAKMVANRINSTGLDNKTSKAVLDIYTGIFYCISELVRLHQTPHNTLVRHIKKGKKGGLRFV